MAKQKMSGDDKKSLYKTGGIYTPQQHKDMNARYGDDARAKAAAMKTDIHKDKAVPRYSPGTEGYKKAVAISEENAKAKAAENRAHDKQYGPGSGAEQRLKAEAASQTEKMKTYSENSANKQEREKEKNKKSEVANPTLKYNRK